MATEKKVVDASILVKWFVHEEDSEKALKLRDDHVEGKYILVVPELAFVEVMNALRYKGKDVKSLIQANTALWDVQLHVEKLNSFLLEKSMTAALKYNLTVYDAVYVALASVFGVQLITADKELQRVPNTTLLK